MNLINKDINILAKEWKDRYLSLSVEKRKKIDGLNSKNYQLNVIKRKRTELKEGDIFLLSPRKNVFFYGKILKVNINHIEQDQFINGKNVVFIFNCKTDKISMDDFNPNYDDLLISPVIVDNSYWNKGIFYTIGNIEITEDEKNLDYGFYDVIDFEYLSCDGKILNSRPKFLGIYGITTIIGVACEIEQELIINPDLLKF